MSICFYSDVASHHTSILACSRLVGVSVLPITLSLSSGAIIPTEQRALIWSVSAHTCLTLHQEDKNRPFLHAPRGHEVAYGLLMSPHINLHFNPESPKRGDATTSDLRGETLHRINPPWTGLHPRCRPFLHYY